MTLERALAIAEGTVSYSTVDPRELWTALELLAAQLRRYEAIARETP